MGKEGTFTVSGTGVYDDSSFNLSEALIREVFIKDGVTEIGVRAFSECKNLTSVTIPDSVTTIDDFAFSECKSLTSVIIPDSVKFIGKKIFEDCTSLKVIRYPAGRDFEENLSSGNKAKLVS